MRIFSPVAAGALVLLASAIPAPDAAAFCRTTTCSLPPSWSPGPDGCVPPTFVQDCAMRTPPVSVFPLFWRNACVGYDIQKNASKWVTLADAQTIVAEAFAQWTGGGDSGTAARATCPADSAGQTSVGLQAQYEGAVDCGHPGYNKDGAPNQHVIIFHDDVWPYDAASTNTATTLASTLGLTTVTFDVNTGEIYDADTEINGTVPLSADDPVPAGGFDLRSIITHEMGHFLGLAHSGDATATMYAQYSPGSTSMRSVMADDVAGICSIYLPDGTRSVDPSVGAGGSIRADACDPTPRHGWSSECDQAPAQSGCAVHSSGTTDGGGRWGEAAVLLLTTVSVLRMRRRGRTAWNPGDFRR